MNGFITYLIFMNMNCITCKKKLVGRQRKYCSLVCKNADINRRHKNYKCQQSRGLNRKVELIESMGGKCEICGYERNYAAMSFHHTTPQEKETTLDIRTLSNSSWEKIREEAKKCQLLCSNCHMEIHYPHLNK